MTRPTNRDVVLEQVRATALALRREALIAAMLLGVATLAITAGIIRDGDVMAFHPEQWVLPSLVGLLLTIGVWKGEDRFGSGFLWRLPVERRRHALVKVFAGWVLLMGAVAVFVLWLLGLALLSGGNILGEETLRFVDPGSFPVVGSPDPGAVQTVRWTPSPLLWLVPFTGATVLYLLTSALALGARRPLRWIAAAVLTVALIVAIMSEIGRAAGSEWLVFAPSRLLRALLYGPYGLGTLLTAGADMVGMKTVLPTGEVVAMTRGAPDIGQWAMTTLAWGGAGLLALWAASSRHRERGGG